MGKRSKRRRENKINKRKNKKPKINYREYIHSKEWQAKASNIKRIRGYTCELCGASGHGIVLHAHHKTYERLGDELESDIMVLCSSCHMAFHLAKKLSKNKVKIIGTSAENQIRSFLWAFGINNTNNDPYANYDLGKSLIRQLPGTEDYKVFDICNKVNIDILDKALLNEARREYIRAKAQPNDYWQGFGDEEIWRAEFNYWENNNG